MLGRKTFTAAEIARSRAAVDAQRAATDQLPAGIFNDLLLALDRPFVHRVRGATGKDANPLNEVEMLVESLMLHDGVVTPIKVLKYDAATSASRLAPGATVALDAATYFALADAFHAELEARMAE